MNFVIIGAGPAGVRAAEALRENAPAAEITLLSGEPGEPYARMAIPYILSGAIGEDGARQRESPPPRTTRHPLPQSRRAEGACRPDGGQVELDDGSRWTTTGCSWPPARRPCCRPSPAPNCPA